MPYTSRLLLPVLLLLCLLFWADSALAADPGLVTSVHKAGVCALRGQVPFQSPAFWHCSFEAWGLVNSDGDDDGV
jgi:hypothetical protein